jgi:hypothetical protein
VLVNSSTRALSTLGHTCRNRQTVGTWLQHIDEEYTGCHARVAAGIYCRTRPSYPLPVPASQQPSQARDTASQARMQCKQAASSDSPCPASPRPCCPWGIHRTRPRWSRRTPCTSWSWGPARTLYGTQCTRSGGHTRCRAPACSPFVSRGHSPGAPKRFPCPHGSQQRIAQRCATASRRTCGTQAIVAIIHRHEGRWLAEACHTVQC